jgi:hypothetical protein
MPWRRATASNTRTFVAVSRVFILPEIYQAPSMPMIH